MMQNLSSYSDYKRKVKDINVRSEIFNNMLNIFDKHITGSIREIEENNFEGAEITLKLKIEVIEQTEDGDQNTGMPSYYYKQPIFNYNINSTLKKTNKSEGAYSEKSELRYQNGKYVLVPVNELQISIFDEVK